MSTDLSEGLTVSTLLGEDLMFSFDGDAKIMDTNVRVSNIIDVDYEAQNGVVHVIDTVILPEQKTTGISEISKLNIKLYPNPANDYVVIETEFGTHDIKITDISGKTKLSKTTDNSITNIDLKNYSPGM